jgi:hypothetical protein
MRLSMLDCGHLPSLVPGKMSTFLTTGMPKKNASGIMRAIGSAATTPIGRADTGPETSWE